ncbi:lantibiotic immunity ABC transporter MutG family permease subunit [Anaerosacchariphilus polymeriproducens]|uniref:Lantibiotic immunity ABC transporter MutG family permease subunit n=1 Tax=Anaerosacchariphilus polymeriproducens TaxID=1812858 RepID=A0A371AXD4_9FIRM|nr:lantibiotic immunity ABC transporter MutG family permease subunit [Anaerosacchariphilus polymeriproducens]RDU24219.1 lantibiotic immunity ABC transporter MutG family permease subunit [Anaerosacchariphilus polymeriproducens]
MNNLIKLFKAESLKMKHTLFLPAHLIIPIIGTLLFLLYSSICGWNNHVAISSFIQIISILFPLIGTFMVSWNLDNEEKAGNFQVLLVQRQSRVAVFFIKIIYLYGMGILSCFVAFFIYYIRFSKMDIGFYLKIFLTVCLCQSIEYLIHVFLRIRFGTGITIGFGILEFLISALMITGLGEGRWMFFPAAWAVRITGYQLLRISRNELPWVLIYAILLIILFILFSRKFESNKSSLG